jgi:hypothetical protein
MTVLVIPPGTTIIKNWAYEYGTMTKVIIPDGVKEIDLCAFQGCSSLQILIMPDSVKVIDWNSFRECSALQGLKIPGGVTKIEWNSFRGCSRLQTLEIPATVTEIEGSAFHGCLGLKTLIVSESVARINKSAFDECSGLQRVWNKSKCELDNCEPWVHLRGETPLLKDLERWTFALHWHWKHPDRITPEQDRLFTVGLHCLVVPIELCQTVFSYIPRA